MAVLLSLRTDWELAIRLGLVAFAETVAIMSAVFLLFRRFDRHQTRPAFQVEVPSAQLEQIPLRQAA